LTAILTSSHETKQRLQELDLIAARRIADIEVRSSRPNQKAAMEGEGVKASLSVIPAHSAVADAVDRI